jgi:hypothetical protein
VGGKRRLGGQLLAGAFAPGVAESIHVLPLTPPVRYLAMSQLVFDPNSYSFLVVKVCVIG